jgi:hypothetical protein
MTTIITVYHGASADFDNRFLQPRPSEYPNSPPFDFGLWVTTDYNEACCFLDPVEDELAGEIDETGEIRVSKNRVITAELDITDAYRLEDQYDEEEALEAIANGKTILLNAEGPDSIFLTSTLGLRVTGEIR